jgi:hypothetical protein
MKRSGASTEIAVWYEAVAGGRAGHEQGGGAHIAASICT